jgi:MFS family permease
MSSPPGDRRQPLRTLPTGIWALGFGSLLMDSSSELIHSVLPVFMVSVLGASLMTVGLVEGITEATAALLKVASGALSDSVRRRKPFVVLGYALGAVTKPFFPLATSIGWVFTARFADRIGKGIRGAPRDALVADITPAHLRGAAYGLRQALDSVGALLGPLVALACMFLLAGDVRRVMWIGVAPAFLAVAVLLVFVREPGRDQARTAVRAPMKMANVRRLTLEFWMVVLLGAVFTLARFSEAFLVLRAHDVGLGLALVPAVLVVMNLCYAGAAFPAGAAADRVDKWKLLAAGLVLLVMADLTLAFARAPLTALVGAALWGVHMALTQGLLAKLVADSAPAELRGTAFGLFNLVSGGALLLANLLAGALWSTFGPAVTFAAGAAFAAVAAIGVSARRFGGHG